MEKVCHRESYTYSNAHMVTEKTVAMPSKHSVHYISHRQCTSGLTLKNYVNWLHTGKSIL